jgi:hypothetical protein
VRSNGRGGPPGAAGPEPLDDRGEVAVGQPQRTADPPAELAVARGEDVARAREDAPPVRRGVGRGRDQDRCGGGRRCVEDAVEESGRRARAVQSGDVERGHEAADDVDRQVRAAADCEEGGDGPQCGPVEGAAAAAAQQEVEVREGQAGLVG